jgi:ERCC4-type nuclease
MAPQKSKFPSWFNSSINTALLAIVVFFLIRKINTDDERDKVNQQNWMEQRATNAEMKEYQIGTSAELKSINSGLKFANERLDNNEKNTKKMNENLFKYIPKYLYQWDDYKTSAR